MEPPSHFRPWLRISAAVIAVATALAMAQPAGAQTATIAESGAWRAFAGTTQDGTRTCGMDVHSTDDRRFLLQAYGGNTWITVRAVSMRWHIPDGTRIPVIIRIGRATWEATARGSGMEAQWRIDGSTIATWETAFRLGSVMEIFFVEGNEPPWRISLRGSNVITSVFSRCLTTLLAPPTQPFASPPSPPPSPATRREHRT